MGQEIERKTWLIAYRPPDTGNGSGSSVILEMKVNVDEASPRDHYLFLYNVEKVEQEIDQETGDIVDIEETEIAKVVGFFSPTVWLYAVSEDTVLYNGERQ